MFGKYKARVDKQGRLVIPVEVRRELNIGPGEPVTVWSERGELRMVTLKQAVENIQAIAAKLKKPGESVVDEFLRERREEAARE